MGFEVGKALEIPDGLITKLDGIDAKVNEIATDSEKMATSFNTAIQGMTDKSDGLLSKLQSVQNVLSSLGGFDGVGLSDVAKNMSDTATEAEKASSGIGSMASMLSSVNLEGKNIAALVKRIKEINKSLTTDRGVPLENQQALVNERKALEDELKVQQRSFSEKMELIRKEIEAREKAFEREDRNRQKIAAREKEIEQSENRHHDARRKKELMYQEMFDKIEAREKKRVDRWMAEARKRAEETAKEEEREKKHAAKIQAQADKEAAALAKKEERERKAADSKKARLEAQKKAHEASLINITQLSKELENLRASEASMASLYEYINKINKALRQKEGEILTPYGEQYYVEVRDALKQELAEREKTERQKEKIQADAEAKAEAREKREQARSERERLRIKREYQARKEAYLSTSKGAMHEAKAAKSYAERASAIKHLEIAIKNLKRTDADYAKHLRRLSDEHKRLSAQQREVEANYKNVAKSQSKLLDTTGQLTRKLALVFSVSQIQGYITKLVQVTGEFERQKVALASILQNKDKADKLFAQITELAVKSPFQLKELVTYTKSLSAYQVEYEKLFDTTKMLADVSSGLGVDMQRLILAFGQVKAANYLRGTEVRQFTEAGFNILGELAKYYEELKGEMVTVGQVQEMVTKRMVKFGDVEEVFKRVTSAGGIFYKMQERQAETLAGQISNLTDSIDIMLNDIGSSKQGVMKDMIGNIRSLVENWRELEATIELNKIPLSIFVGYLVLARVGSTKLASSITMLGKKMLIYAGFTRQANSELVAFSIKTKIATLGTNALKLALKGLAGLGVGALVMGVVYAFEKMYLEMTKASRMADELKGKTDALLHDGEYNAAKLANGFEHLANTVVDSSRSVDEQREALAELKRTYGDIVPSQLLEARQLKELKGNYESVTRAIYAKIEAQVKEKQLNAVSEVYGRDVQSAFDDLKKLLENEQKLLPEDANNVIAELRKAIEDGTLKIGQDYTAFVEGIIQNNYKVTPKIRDSFKTLLGTSFFGKDAFRIKKVFLPSEQVNNFVESILTLHKEIKKVEETQLYSLGGSGEYNALKKSLDKQRELIAKEKEKIAEKPENKEKGVLFISNEQIAVEKKMLSDWVEFVKTKGSEIKSAYNVPIDPKSTTVAKFIADVNNEIENVDGTKPQKEVRKIINAFAALNDVSLVDVNDVMMQSSESMSEYAKRIETHIKTLNERMLGYKAGVSKYITYIQDDAQYAAVAMEKALAEYIKAMINPLGKESERNKAHGKELQRLKEQIALIKKAGEEYKKLLKYYSKGEAQQRIADSFSDAFSTLGLPIDMDFGTDGIIDAIEHITNKAGEEGRKAIKKATSDLKAEVGIKLKEKDLKVLNDELENAFSAYELSMELDESGLDQDAIKDIFKVDIFSISDLKQKIEGLKPIFYAQGIDYQKSWDKAMKKVTDLEGKELKKRLANYSKYLKDTVSKRAAIEMEGKRKIDEVNDIEEFTPIQKEHAKRSIRKETQQKLDKQAWDDFKQSDMYIQMFENLDFVSTKAINQMREKLAELRSSLKNLSPAQLKEITRAMERLDDLAAKRNPFKNLFNKDPQMASRAWQQVGGYMQEVGDTASSIGGSLENVFGNMSDGAKDAIGSFNEIANAMSQTSHGISQILQGDVIGGAMNVVKGFFNTIGSIFRIGDKKKEREIKRQLKNVEKLKDAYDELSEAMQKAYSMDILKNANKEMNANLEARNKSLEEAIKKEEDKKKTDKERIEEWQKEIDENNKQIAENKKQLLAELGGFGDDSSIKSAAEQFASSWLDAFIQTENGLEGLEDTMKDWLKNAVQKQLLVNLSKEFVTPLLNSFDEMFKAGSLGGENMLPEEAAAWKDLYESKSKEFNDRAQAYLEALKAAGIDLGGDAQKDDEMSGLSRSIAGLSEQTGEALEALLESCRYFASDSNMQLKQIANALTNPEFESPLFSEIRFQSEQMRIMVSIWSSLTMSKSGVQGKCLRVNIV